MIAKEYGRYLIGMGLFYALANAARGGEEGFSTGVDPTSSEFGKLNFNGTRIDPLSGLAQSTVFLSRVGRSALAAARGEKLKPNETAYNVASRGSFVRSSPRSPAWCRTWPRA